MSRPGETTTEEHQGDGVPFAGPDTGREGDAPARLAVFDFDGTSIEGNSPVLLVQHLMERGMLRKRVIFRILLWAAAYKLRLPQNESKVRSLVFTAFEGRSADEVDRFLADFYDERIALLFRPRPTPPCARMRRRATRWWSSPPRSSPSSCAPWSTIPSRSRYPRACARRPTARTPARWRACPWRARRRSRPCSDFGDGRFGRGTGCWTAPTATTIPTARCCAPPARLRRRPRPAARAHGPREGLDDSRLVNEGEAGRLGRRLSLADGTRHPPPCPVPFRPVRYLRFLRRAL